MREVKINHRFCVRWAFSSLLLMLGGCSPGTPEYLAGNLNGFNHTAAAINYFSVNGAGGRNIPPFGEGGGVCCIMLPSQWQPNLMMTVEWETDPDPRAFLPSVDSRGYRDAYEKHKANYQKHTAAVELPYYETKTLCAPTVHFLPCHQIKATTSCTVHGEPNYPIKEPARMKEPAVCPK